MTTCGRFHKHVTRVTNDTNKISCTVLPLHAGCSVNQNDLAYFTTAVSYRCKMFMKLTPGIVVIKLFFRCHCVVQTEFTKDHRQGTELNSILAPFDMLCMSAVVKFKSWGKWATTGFCGTSKPLEYAFSCKTIPQCFYAELCIVSIHDSALFTPFLKYLQMCSRLGMPFGSIGMFPGKEGRIQVLAGLAPSSQMVESTLRTHSGQNRVEKLLNGITKICIAFGNFFPPQKWCWLILLFGDYRQIV